MTKILTLMLCITLLFTGCKRENIGPKFYGSREANMAGIKFIVEKQLGGRPGNFEKVILTNGSYYYESEESIVNDKTVEFLTKTEWTWNTTWNAFMVEADASLQDEKYGKRHWYLGTVPYGLMSGTWGKGLMLVQEKQGGLSFLAIIY